MQSPYVALDLETTGLDSDRDAIIEIGAARFRGKEVLDEFNTLVNPGRSLSADIIALTGITDEDLVGAPHLHEVLPKLGRFVGNCPIVGHNVGFDLGFLRRRSALTSNPGLDTFKPATILIPEARRYSLGSLASLLGFLSPTAHRALADAHMTRQLFLELFQRALALSPSLLEELVRQGEHVEWPTARFFRRVLQVAAQEAFTGALAPPEPAKTKDVPLLITADADALQPAEIARPLDVAALTALLQEGGAFADQFPSYEYRPQQVEMLQAVARAFSQGQHLMVEAPTGVGKSLAYLIPAVHWAVQNSERVVISTNTINLQEQLYTKDLPDMEQILPLALRAAVLKGRSHYLCPARLATLRRIGPTTPEEMDVLARVLVWQPTTQDGDGDELFLPTARDRAIWHSLSAKNDGCDPERCRYFHKRSCYFYNARHKANAAHLVIVNHALLLADVTVQNRAIPEHRYLIVDEAHHLEDATTRGLSFETDQQTIRRLLEEIGRSRGAGTFSGLLGQVISRCRGARLDTQIMARVENFGGQVARAVERANYGLDTFFEQLGQFVEDARDGRQSSFYAYRQRITPAQRVQPSWDAVEMALDDAGTPLFAVVDGLKRLAEGLEELVALGLEDAEEMQVELVGVGRRLEEVHVHLNGFVAQPNHRTIYWVEVAPRDSALSVHAAPLHVGPLVEEHLFHKKESVILTSATLRTGQSFDFLRERLNAWEAEELAVDSPFDYPSSTLVYVVEDVPEPGQTGYQKALGEAMSELFKATRGRALALFTSYSQLRAIKKAVKQPLSRADIVTYAQGEGLSRNQLLENFRSTERSVLLGTRSFWEGVDVPGEALSCLVIAKLPFNVPSDPVFAARSETFDDPFLEYAVPGAVLQFLQGFGRLIRTRTDRGVVAIFDRRLITRQYGQSFLNSLPGPTIRRGSVTKLPRAAAEWLKKEPVRGEDP